MEDENKTQITMLLQGTASSDALSAPEQRR
jgi:hypothetical protein